MLLLGFHLVHFVKPMEFKKGMLLMVWNDGGEIIRTKENQKQFIFQLDFSYRIVRKDPLVIMSNFTWCSNYD